MFVDEPLQYDDVTGVTVRVGDAFTVIVCVVVPEHPAAVVPVTVYVRVEVELQVTVAPVVVLRPVDGDHE